MPTLYYTDHYEFPLPAEHRFPLAKYRKLRDALSADGIFNFVPAPQAAPEDIELAHEKEFVRNFISGAIDAQAMRRIGFPWSEGLVARSLGSVGGTLAATQDALVHGWGGTLAGGTHHAFRGEGSGFCVFNDIAISIFKLRGEKKFLRVAVVDLDVHQGDGTAQIFAGDANVFTLSIHGRNNFPFRKQKSKLDVELPDGTQDSEYLAALDDALPQVLAFKPEILFFQSGVDALATDTLGRLALSPEGMRARDRRVLETAQANGIPPVITLGGGYSDPIERTVEAHASTYSLAAEMYDGRR